MKKNLLKKVFEKKQIKNENIVNKVEEKIKVAQKGIEKEILLNVPNAITLMRLILSFVFVYMLFQNFPMLAIFTVFTVAAITDWFDGYFARTLKQTSKFGARMDQIVDRIFTIMIVLSLVFYLLINKHTPGQNIFELSPNNVYLLLFLSTSREIIGAPGVFIALIRKKSAYYVKYVGKVTTFIQSVTLGSIILGLPISIYLAMATCIIGIISGFDYLKYSLS